MFTYSYKAADKGNSTIESTAEGLSAFFVRRKLEKQGLTVFRIERKRKKGARDVSSLFQRVAEMSSYHQILFFRNFSMMLGSGISIAQALDTLSRQVKGLGVRSALQQIRREIENGRTLSGSMAKYPRLFQAHVVKTVAVGEETGRLSDTMDRISEDIQKNYELRRKVIGAITYPAVIILFMFVVAFMLIIYVLPQLTVMFNDLGAPIPKTTVVLQIFGSFCLTYTFEIAVAIISFIIAFWLLMGLTGFRLAVHSMILRIPIFGPLLLEYNLVRLTRALNTLLSGGITFPAAIEASRGVIKNEAFRQSLDRVYPIVLHGGTFSDAISVSPSLYPDQLLQLILVGEQSGRLSFALDQASQHYERSVGFQTQMLTTLIEPFLMLTAGILVGLLAYSMFAPLYQVANFI